MQKLLILTDWYLPAYKAGGPVRSIFNLQQQLKGIYDIYILTSDRDLADTTAFTGIDTDLWIRHDEHTSVYYLSQQKQDYSHLSKIITALSPDIMYLNSMYSKVFSLMPLWYKLKNAPELNTILCPRGMLRPSAVSNKAIKKKLFLRIMRILDIAGKIRFHATDAQEESDIRTWFGNKADIQQISNVPGMTGYSPVTKNPGQLKILFAGRIHPVKNLHFALEVLKETDCQITFRIAGNIEDPDYLHKCRQIIHKLPPNIQTQITGALTNEQMLQEYHWCHLMFLPTTGENFGHAIFETLSAGRPVLISDQTPWKSLEQTGAGAAIPLTEPGQYRHYIQKLCKTDQASYDQICHQAMQYATDFTDKQDFRTQYQQLFTARHTTTI